MTMFRALVLLAALVGSAAYAQRPGSTAPVAPRAEQKARSDQKADTQLRAELEQALNAYADRYTTHMVAATAAIERDNPSAEQRRLAHLMKLGTVSSVYDIATERDVFNRLLDMVLMVTLQSYSWIDEDRAEKLFGERGEILRRSIRQMRTDIWTLASRVARPEQLQQLDSLIIDWRKRNPDIELVSYTRLGDLTVSREQNAALEEIKRASGLFAELAEATRVAEDTRLLAERMFFQAKRMPFLLNWQAEALINEMLAKPEIVQALRSTEHLTDALGKLPPQIRAEREALVATLEDREGRLAGLLGEVRKTTAAADGLAARAVTLAEAAERVTENVRATTTTVEGIMARNSASGGSTRPDKPFEIEPYLRMAAEANHTVAGLNAALERLDAMAAKKYPMIDRLFWRALALMAAFFALLFAYRWATSRLARH
jgi:hypothetical protein